VKRKAVRPRAGSAARLGLVPRAWLEREWPGPWLAGARGLASPLDLVGL
jgi:hypothetical protein